MVGWGPDWNRTKIKLRTMFCFPAKDCWWTNQRSTHWNVPAWLLKAHASPINPKTSLFCLFLLQPSIWFIVHLGAYMSMHMGRARTHTHTSLYMLVHAHTLAHKPLQLLWWKLHRHVKERRQQQQQIEESVLAVMCGCVHADYLFSPAHLTGGSHL